VIIIWLRGSAFLVLSVIVVALIPSGAFAVENHAISSAPLQNTAESYSIVKIIMPTGSDLRQINDGWGIETGGSLFGFVIEVGIVLNVWYVVIGGNITVKPLTKPSIVLNPGDQLTVTFGTFHIFGWGEEGNKYLFIGRFYGVTIMPI
jgi:hypothetical protein